MRYLWDLYPDYLHTWIPRWQRPFIAPVSSWLRMWDTAGAARVDEFVANSENVRRRIRRAWRRVSRVVYPPVAVDTFFWKAADDYFLIVSELVPYKRVADAVALFSRTGRRLRIVGQGPEYGRLRRLAGATVEFCGRVPDAQLRDLYARCRALLMPGEEDFGITAVEALASGKPVVALGRGGALETVPPMGGVLYPAAGEDHLTRALEQFEAIEPVVNPGALHDWAMRFSEAEFIRKMRAVLNGPLQAASDAATPS